MAEETDDAEVTKVKFGTSNTAPSTSTAPRCRHEDFFKFLASDPDRMLDIETTDNKQPTAS